MSTPIYFSAVVAIGILVTYIKELHNSLSSANEDNLRLIDGMHEGLLILNNNEKNPSVMFCNFAVKKIIDNFLAKESPSPKHSVSEFQRWISAAVFEPIKIADGTAFTKPAMLN